ncbi:hypothetical protein RRG08_026912 [Elysia crispata]|uniref:Uncharacterized protein n=1 Tax=Elysia crispata TaxID=231223 RepID=A0AAE1AVZ8_9GAST|nr:hypothetical protein RRG08_026912 [Elysia crispata]
MVGRLVWVGYNTLMVGGRVWVGYNTLVVGEITCSSHNFLEVGGLACVGHDNSLMVESEQDNLHPQAIYLAPARTVPRKTLKIQVYRNSQ